MLPQAPPKKREGGKNDEINTLPLTRRVDHLQNYQKFSSKWTLKGKGRIWAHVPTEERMYQYWSVCL